MNMIEKVARAIAPEEFKMWQQRFDFEMQQSGDEVEARAFAESFFDRASVYAKARAAIKAMREPTDAMAAASWAATVNVDPERRMFTDMMSTETAHQFKAKARYTAMIDAALQEPSP